jgi:signal transduction histidine kinase
MASALSEVRPPAARRPNEAASVRLASVVVLLAVVVVLAVIWSRGDANIVSRGWELVAWTAVVVAASVWPIGEGVGTPYLALDLPVLLACAFVLGPGPAGIVALIASTTRQELSGRMSVSRCVWNHSQIALAVIATGVVFQALAGDPRHWPDVLLASEAGLAADALINYCLVALIYAIGSSGSFVQVLKTLHIGEPKYFALFYAALGVVAAMMATVYVHVGPATLLVFLVPVVLAREALRQTLSVARANRALVARREALRVVDQRIAEERADERDRIAEALHDDVLQSVFDVTIRAHVVRECYRSGRLLDLEDAVPDLVASTERVADELRDVIHGLRESQVGHAGLVDSVALLTSHLQDQTGITFVTDIEASLPIRAEVELVVYQVAREALVNASRHSSADTVWVSLRRCGVAVELSVLDNGVGFDPRSRIDRHFGLELMAERVAAVGGVLDITSSPGNGALVVARFEDLSRA